MSHAAGGCLQRIRAPSARASGEGRPGHVIEQRLTAGVGVGASEVGLGAVLDAVADWITVQAADGRIVYANAAAAELIGFPDAATLVAAAPGESSAGSSCARRTARRCP